MKESVEDRSATILCVDDEENPLALRKLVLQGAGYKVLTATTSEEALRLFAENDVRLVITDHLLVKGSGTQLSRRLKEVRSGVPIAILSGVVDPPEDLDDSDIFISKTSGPAELLSVVARLIKT